jgi:hypothetical protein
MKREAAMPARRAKDRRAVIGCNAPETVNARKRKAALKIKVRVPVQRDARSRSQTLLLENPPSPSAAAIFPSRSKFPAHGFVVAFEDRLRDDNSADRCCGGSVRAACDAGAT